MSYVITLGRSLGSGGREIGQLLAERLDIPYYDKRLIDEAAAHAGICPEVVGRGDERQTTLASTIQAMGYGMTAVPWYASRGMCEDNVYHAQSDYITHVASQGPCLIVGRSADYTLRQHPGLIKVFLHASQEACCRRIMARGDAATPEDALRLIKRINKMRASYYNFYTDKEWGRASSYDLCLDTSLLTAEQCVDILDAYVKMRLQTIQ